MRRGPSFVPKDISGVLRGALAVGAAAGKRIVKGNGALGRRRPRSRPSGTSKSALPHGSEVDRATSIVRAAVGALRDPYERSDLVAALGELTGDVALVRMRRNMLKSAEGARILRDKPSIEPPSVTLEMLDDMPDRTSSISTIRSLRTS